MAQKFPRDRFDTVPHGIERVGAHRAPSRRASGWIAFGWAALATVVLAGIGIWGVVSLGDRIDASGQSTSTPEPTATAEPTIAPDQPVTVLNGTTVSGLAAQAAETLQAAAIPVGGTANASENDLTETYVYYATPELEGAARGVAQAISEADVRYDAKFAEIGTPLVLVVGSDFAAAVGAAG
ncbi:LytR family transcriptional regulator [Agromyces intestinalis]|uniref:LytR family transcriptional regulator n=1 Tax=Agromyces intestinalis TaxID=2592652 RepID=A0A5C1YH83_9MICO|nr:LytR C-terminal domain-containing protein [Agromyces intestinalis]QEO15313.1 LytR family transcriptional regulator [Agromyces intestinalis]